MRPGTAIIGVAAWNYSGPGGSVLRLANAEQKCLLNLTDARGSSIEGLALDGRDLGTNVHGMFVDRTAYAKHEDGFRIEKCQVLRFTGDGMNLSCVWCFSVRHCMLAYNKGDGMTLRGWDGFILDNWLSGNGRAGFAARDENASVTFTANRIEWNGTENMLITGGDGYQITGNFFDRAGTVGIALRKSSRGCTPGFQHYRQLHQAQRQVRRPGTRPTIRRRSCWKAAPASPALETAFNPAVTTAAMPASGVPPTGHHLPGPSRTARHPRQRAP